MLETMLGLAALCGLGEVVDNWWIHGGSQIALRRKTGIERESASRMVIVLFHSIMEVGTLEDRCGQVGRRLQVSKKLK